MWIDCVHLGLVGRMVGVATCAFFASMCLLIVAFPPCQKQLMIQSASRSPENVESQIESHVNPQVHLKREAEGRCIS